MDKHVLRFLNGEVNVARIEFIVTRQPRMPNGAEHITAVPIDGEYISFERWHNPKKEQSNNETPKHSGGKKPYVMLMVEEIDRLRDEGVKNVEELLGFLVCLSRYVQWNTGKLIRRRSKRPLQYKDLSEMFSCGNRKLNRILKSLQENDLLYSTTEGYFVSTRIIKKGKTKKEAVRNGL